MKLNTPPRHRREGEERTKAAKGSGHKVVAKGKVRRDGPFAKTELRSAEKAERVPYPLLLARVFLSPLLGVSQEELLVVLVLRGLNITSKTKKTEI